MTASTDKQEFHQWYLSILRYKFYGRRSYASTYGRLLAMKLLKEGWDDTDVLTWVPISRLRKFRRGYDQVELFARVVAEELGMELTPTLRKIQHTKPQSTMEGLAKLKPVNAGGVSTAGNSSGVNDGASFVLMMTPEKAKELGFVPYAKWVTGADMGVEPRYMGIGPAFSNMKALKMAGLTVNDMDVWECNEAFAAQNLCVIKETEAQSGVTFGR